MVCPTNSINLIHIPGRRTWMLPLPSQSGSMITMIRDPNSISHHEHVALALPQTRLRLRPQSVRLQGALHLLANLGFVNAMFSSETNSPNTPHYPLRKTAYARISSQIRTKLRDWAVRQASACCYSQAALSSNDSKLLYLGSPNSDSTRHISHRFEGWANLS